VTLPEDCTALLAGHAARSDHDKFTALRMFVPEDDDAPVLAPFLVSVAEDADEEDLVRIEAIRLLELLGFHDDELAASTREALIQLAGRDEDYDVRGAAAAAVFRLPGAERELARMRTLIDEEPEEIIREQMNASMHLFLDRKATKN
jgi:hypothetical protein